HPQRVTRPTRQTTERVARTRHRRTVHLRATDIHVVTRHTDVVSRSGPRQRNTRLRRRTHRQPRRCRRISRVRAGARRSGNRRPRRHIPGRVERLHPQRVTRPTRQTTERVARTRHRRTVHLRATDIHVVTCPTAAHACTSDRHTSTLYPATPTLSVEAVHDNAILDCVVEPTANPDGADGSVVSVESVCTTRTGASGTSSRLASTSGDASGLVIAKDTGPPA